MKTKLIFAGGGTGGHLYPIVSIVRELKKLSLKDLELYFIAPNRNNFKKLEQEEGIIPKRIISGKFRRHLTLKNLFSPIQIIVGIFQSLVFVWKNKPNMVFLKGGYGALPMGIVAALHKIPIIIHESDTYPGLITRIFSRWAKLVLVSFEETSSYLPANIKIRVLGNPVRKFGYNNQDNNKAKKMLRIDSQRKMILVLGGSQGSSEINELIFNSLSDLLVNFSLIHSTGKKNFSEFQKKIKKLNQQNLNKYYKVHPFIEEKELELAYSASDIVISRSGASMVFEIAQAGKPSILIPLIGSAADHQRKNAYAYMKSGACLVIEKPNLNKTLFVEKIKEILTNKSKSKLMIESAQKFAKPNAARDIAKKIAEELHFK